MAASAPLLLVIACLAVIFSTGLAVLHASRLRFRHGADLVLAAFAAGISALAASVYVLLQLHAYSLPAAIILVAAPFLYLVWLMVRGEFAKPESGNPLSGLARGWLDLAAALLCVSLLAVGFLDALTSPPTAWDAVISWDKWATEWALRTDMSERKLGYYPQLMPMASSLLYKITGTAREPLSMVGYSLHAMQPVIGIFALASIMRMAVVLQVAAWPALLLFFGASSIWTALTSGAGDLISAALFTICVTLFFSALRGDISAGRGFAPFFAILFFGVLFSKSNNAVILLIPAVTFLSIRGGVKPWPGIPRGVLPGLGLAVLLFSTFLAHQFLNIGTPLDRLHLDELNFNPANISTSLALNTAGTFGDATPAMRAWNTAGRLLGDYSIPVSLRPPVLALALLGLFLCGLSARLWPLLATVAAQIGIWAYYTSYDNRNLAPALPLLGICISGGFHAVLTKFSRNPVPQRLLRVSVALLSAALLALVVPPMTKELRRSAQAFQEQKDARFQAMSAELPARMQLFFPAEFHGYQLLQALRPFREARHILAGSRMYRWFANGGYPLSTWWTDGLGSGDGMILAANGLPARRAYYDRLTQIVNDGTQRLYLVDKAPVQLTPKDVRFAGQTPPRLLTTPPGGEWIVESIGPSGLVIHDLPEQTWKDSDSLTWRVLIAGDIPEAGAVTPMFLSEQPGSIDPARSHTVEDLARISEKLAAYSGIITFTGRGAGKLAVGLQIHRPGVRIHIKEFRISAWR